MGRRSCVALALLAATLTGGCTTAERNQVALDLCSRQSWCTATEQPPEPSGPPQVQAMEGRKRERVISPNR
ncbi:MAG: hypothetical protein PGN16_13760 [Sphingomonas phyllosphaerae]|uniref:hypothetical protein n=1 Tax=Sphingomonas phyllosphaerae TaxID=257003 RepID=UPI002FFD4DE8